MELDEQKITDKVAELLYMLDEEGNEFAAQCFQCLWSSFLLQSTIQRS